MNLIRVVTKVHPVWDDKVDHCVEVSLKHSTINLEKTDALLDDGLW